MNNNQFKSHSQVGQDRWVYERLGAPGVFLDIGSGHPFTQNNTYALESVGWTGWLIDLDDYVAKLSVARKATFLKLDATKIDWMTVEGMPKTVDYLSLDVDHGSLEALKRFTEKLRFKVATIEHDSYRFGLGPRDAMREVLTEAGYMLERADVSDRTLPFEDWWIDPQVVV